MGADIELHGIHQLVLIGESRQRNQVDATWGCWSPTGHVGQCFGEMDAIKRGHCFLPAIRGQPKEHFFGLILPHFDPTYL
jgi:hypothetical protein